MSFINTDFTFNGTHSINYGVKLVRLSGGLIGTPIAGGKSMSEEYIGYRDEPFFYKTDMKPINLSMTFLIGDVDSATPAVREDVFEWLYSPRAYADFKSEDDYDSVGGVYDRLYKLIFTSPLEFQSADLENGYFTLTAQAHPFAYTEVTTQNETISSTPTQITINNPTNVRDASNNFYYYPKISIDMNGSTSFRMVNTSDSNREFELDTVTTNEQLVIDNKLKYIETDEVDTNRIANLTDKRWFRLVQGDNVINVHSLCALQIVCQFPIML